MRHVMDCESGIYLTPDNKIVVKSPYGTFSLSDGVWILVTGMAVVDEEKCKLKASL